jgi:hypothetical protein
MKMLSLKLSALLSSFLLLLFFIIPVTNTSAGDQVCIADPGGGSYCYDVGRERGIWCECAAAYTSRCDYGRGQCEAGFQHHCDEMCDGEW